MSEWVIPIALVLAWVTLVGSTWLYIAHVEARANHGYVQGWEDGWKQHVGAQLSEDDAYSRAYTEGWLACLDTLEKSAPPESKYRRWLDDPRFPDFSRLRR